MSSPLETPAVNNRDESLPQDGVLTNAAAETELDPTAQSGAGLEQPVDTFNTPLADAVKEGMVDPVPESPEHHPATSTGEAVPEDEAPEESIETEEPAAEPGQPKTLAELGIGGLTNPFMEKAEKQKKGHRSLYIALGAGAAAVAAAISVIAGMAGGKGHAATTENNGPINTLSAEQRAGYETTPVTLNDNFLNLVLTNGSPKALSESYDLFNGDAQSRITRQQWVQEMTDVRDYYNSKVAQLQNNDQLISAATTHSPVVAKSIIVGNDGYKYDVTVEEIYNDQTQGWEVDHFNSSSES